MKENQNICGKIIKFSNQNKRNVFLENFSKNRIEMKIYRFFPCSS